jgi:hypothetical protein
VLLAARTAIDAAVANAAEEKKPIDVALAADVMNLMMNRDCLRDLHNLRLVCTVTMRGSLPVPSYLLKELPTGVVEAFLGEATREKCPSEAFTGPWCCIQRMNRQEPWYDRRRHLLLRSPREMGGLVAQVGLSVHTRGVGSVLLCICCAERHLWMLL